MFTIKKMLGIAPKIESDGSCSPSPIALKLATKSKTDYDHRDYPNAYTGGKHRVMMICSEQRTMAMKNGKYFSTGNHPVEMLVPMLHLEQAGFDIDVYTPTGESVKIEMWAMPREDDSVKSLYEKHKSNLENPGSLREFVHNAMDGTSPYIAVYIPGGHGAMLGLPENRDVESVLRWAHEQDKYVLSICHGPAALLAVSLSGDKNDFLYRGYKMAVFPDSLDKMSPLFGYLPGQLPWFLGETLQSLGVEIVNKKANGTCYQDRKLITGDSPDAANEFGRIAAEALLSAVSE